MSQSRVSDEAVSRSRGRYIHAVIAAAARSVAVLVCVALTGCLGYGRYAEQVREGFVGMTARQVANCVGTPHSTEQRDDVEEITYLWELAEGTRPGPGVRAPLLPEGTSDPAKVRRGEVGFCELGFELRDGVVESVRSRGQDARGLSADVDCLLVFRHCVVEEP